MQPIKEAAAEFLAGKRVAVTGVSRTGKSSRGDERSTRTGTPFSRASATTSG